MNINWSVLEGLLNADEQEILKDKEYLFIDNGAQILTVAHADTVRKGKSFLLVREGKTEGAMGVALDDRLGVYTVLHHLPVIMGIKCDVLITCDEEFLASTSALFKPPRQYNWIVEFDRAGNDVVTYQYKDNNWTDALAEFAKVGIGTYSDIADMDMNGCSAVNWGIAYHGQHTDECTFYASNYIEAMRKFARFYHKFNRTFFAHVYTPRWTYNKNRYNSSWDNYGRYIPVTIPSKTRSLEHGYAEKVQWDKHEPDDCMVCDVCRISFWFGGYWITDYEEDSDYEVVCEACYRVIEKEYPIYTAANTLLDEIDERFDS